jgi:NitT/TauT family transport system ATP-binding protein
MLRPAGRNVPDLRPRDLDDAKEGMPFRCVGVIFRKFIPQVLIAHASSATENFEKLDSLPGQRPAVREPGRRHGMTPLAAGASPETLTTAAMSRPLVSLRGVAKRYANGTLAVTGVDLDLRAGEFVSLLGPSGCGKSTVLRLIAGLGDASAGRIDWPAAEQDWRGRPVRDVGFVFQDATLMPWATALRNVMLPLRLRKVPTGQAAARATAALSAVGLEGFLDAYPRELSGGMKMRVSIARALVTEPKILLLDEPFAALDEITRQKLNDDLLALWAEKGFTVVFVTHSVFESVYLSQRIVVMAARPGRVIASLEVGGPVPRDASFRTTADYVAACKHVSATLVEAIAA